MRFRSWFVVGAASSAPIPKQKSELPGQHGSRPSNPPKKLRKSGQQFDLSVFFHVVSGPDFAKISAAVLRIVLVSFRAPETNIWPISFKLSVFFWFVDPQKYENPTFSFYLLNNRPGNHAQIVDLAERIPEKKKQLCTTKSDRLGVKTRSRLSPKALTRRTPSKKHVFPSGNHHPGKRKFPNSFVPFIFFNDSTYTSISFYPASGPNVIGSNNRTNGSPPLEDLLRPRFQVLLGASKEHY